MWVPCRYDYAGYGCSTGAPSASQTCADIQAVYDVRLSSFSCRVCSHGVHLHQRHALSTRARNVQHLVKELGIPPSKIILYGQSVGSGPTVRASCVGACVGQG